ncbi:MAG TPA: hypothetical protein VL403_11140 [Candidatus Kryptonia bacterium]|nr:hypothetical protein [Candidatus Kryptonia bacterium]
MRRIGLTVLVLGALLLVGRAARAEETDLPRNPGAAFGAACINLAYFPVRLALSTAWTEVSGVVGWLTGGNESAAEDVWNLTRGPAYVTPGMLAGRERFRFGNWESGH